MFAEGGGHEQDITVTGDAARLEATVPGDRVDDALRAGDVIDVLSLMLRAGGERLGERYGAAEEFRVVVFGGMEGLLDRLGERR